MLSGQFLHSDSTMLVELMSQARETPEVPQHGLSLICKPPEAVEGTVMVQRRLAHALGT